MRVAGEDGGEKLAVTTANIDHAREGAEVVGVSDSLIAPLAQRDHGSLEQRGLLRVLRKPVEPGVSKDLVERWCAGPDRMQELLESEIGFAVDHADEFAWARAVGAQPRSHLRQCKMVG